MSTNDIEMESQCDQLETIMEIGSGTENMDVSDEQDHMNKSNGMEVAVMLPPPPVLVNLVAAVNASGNVPVDSRPPSSMTSASDKDEEEVLSCQVLSARSSTPYTVQGVCCANANCGLEATTDSSNTSQWKDEQTQLVSEIKEDVIGQIDVVSKNGHFNGHMDERKKYSRSDLLDIRDVMTIIRPECLESARLQRLHFRKQENSLSNSNGVNKSKTYRNSNPPNDLMPAFFKRKAAALNGNNSNNSTGAIVYDNFKYNDSNPFSHHSDSGSSSGSNHRRIGSGRISNREVNWDYIPEEDPDKNNLPEFFNTKDSSGSIHSKPQRSQKKHELDDNANFVKRVISSVVTGESSFRSNGSKHSMNTSSEERYNSNASGSTNNRSDEPEWFSCGPTSRLDTIELCGFNESDQQKIRLEMSKNKTDSNNNRQESSNGHNNKEKKHLAFQFDDFSTSHSNKSSNGSVTNSGPKMPGSKFMPLFSVKKREEDANATSAPNSTTVNTTPAKKPSLTQSLNEFLKRNDLPSVNFSSQKEKLSTAEMPSVEEIEAKWMNNQPNELLRNKSFVETFNNTSETFKNMIRRMCQQADALPGGSTSFSPTQASQPNQSMQAGQQKQPSNSSNNTNPVNRGNIANFLRHRHMQQQIMQANQNNLPTSQIQFNTILSRPDTQMLLLSLIRGEISKHGLIVQLSNPNLSETEREAISAVLTFSSASPAQQQMAINPTAQQQQQQLIANQLQYLAFIHQMNKSPKRNGNPGLAHILQINNSSSVANNPRTYTQEELQSHANFILQNAMLKKKLEEKNVGIQKIIQVSMMNGNMNNNLRGNVNDSMAGSKNFHYPQQSHQQHQQQQQSQQQHRGHQQQNNSQHTQQQRHRKGSNSGSRSNQPTGRRRSTSSSSSNTANSGRLASQMQRNSNTQMRRQLEQRRNTIATATVGRDDFNQISQRI